MSEKIMLSSKNNPFGHPSSLHRPLNNSGRQHDVDVLHGSRLHEDFEEDMDDEHSDSLNHVVGHYKTGDYHIRPYDGHISHGRVIDIDPSTFDNLSDEEMEAICPYEEYERLAHHASVFLGFKKPYERFIPSR